MPKTVKGRRFEIFYQSILLQNRKKNEGGPFGDIERICEKKSHKAEITCTKNFGQGRDSNPRPSAWQTSKILINLYAKCQKLRLSQPQIQTMRLAV